MNKYTRYKAGDEITYSFPNLMGVIAYLCHSSSMLIKEAPGVVVVASI